MRLLLCVLILCFLQNCNKDNGVLVGQISEIKPYRLSPPPIINWERKFNLKYQGTFYRYE